MQVLAVQQLIPSSQTSKLGAVGSGRLGQLGAQSLAIALGGLTLLASVGTSAQASSPDDIRRLLSTRACAGCELNRAGLVFANLEQAELSQANLSQANLSRATLSGADLRGANLSGAVLYGANLYNADLSGADLRGADLRGAYLGGANFEGGQLQGAALQGAIAIPPDMISAETYQAWAMNEAQASRHEAAIGYYNQALQQDPQLAKSYLGRSFSVSVLGQLGQAVRDAETAKSLFEAEGDEGGAATAAQVLLTIDQAEAARQDLAANPQKAASSSSSGRQRSGGRGLGRSIVGLFQRVAPMVFQFLL